MNIVDARCMKCGGWMRWLSGTPRVCAFCRHDQDAKAEETADQPSPTSNVLPFRVGKKERTA